MLHGVALAQNAPAPAPAPAATASQPDLKEIIVTTRRKNESLQNVPLAVSVVGQLQIESQHLTSIANINALVPSLSIQPGQAIGRSSPNFSMRGLTLTDFTVFSDPPINVYFNDVLVARTQGLNLGFFDIGAVEAVKGPQGTLFGHNSTAGAVLIRSNLPVDHFEASVSLGYGSFDQKRADVMINSPIGDIANIRFAGHMVKDDGWITDIQTGKKINATKEYGLRLGADIHPSEALHSLTFINYNYGDDGGTGYVAIAKIGRAHV